MKLKNYVLENFLNMIFKAFLFEVQVQNLLNLNILPFRTHISKFSHTRHNCQLSFRIVAVYVPYEGIFILNAAGWFSTVPWQKKYTVKYLGTYLLIKFFFSKSILKMLLDLIFCLLKITYFRFYFDLKWCKNISNYAVPTTVWFNLLHFLEVF